MVRNRVKELRKERRLRQEELAGRINISQQTVSRIENGDNALAADILMSLANYLVCPLIIFCIGQIHEEGRKTRQNLMRFRRGTITSAESMSS